MGKSLNQAKANAIRYTKKKVEHWQLVSLALAGYDAISIIIAFFLALWFRFDCRYSMIPKEFLGAYLKFIGIYVIFSLFVFWRLRLYNSIWRFASYSELVRMIVATGISSLFHCTGMTLFLGRMPLSYYFFGTVIQFGMTLMVRFAYRFVLLERSKRRKTEEIAKAKRVLLIGGGKAGQIILRDIKTAKELKDIVCCIIDDNPNKWGRYIEGVKSVICLSTDKAAYPVNAMGTSKAMMEKVIVAKSRTVDSEKTKICCTRYGNVMCSRGSVIPLWIEQIKAGNPITITEPSMTRFIMSLEEAVDLVLFAFENGISGDILVQKAPACTIEVLAKAVTELFAPGHEIKVIGIRHGEKMYETLLTNEECANAIDMGEFYRVPCDKRDLNYDKYFKDGDIERNTLTEFDSNNTKLLSVEQVKEKLLTLQYIQDALSNN